ncbi:MAG: hypothetical protein WC917_00555 [Bacilli bacterium]|jgi:hypothetical protein
MNDKIDKKIDKVFDEIVEELTNHGVEINDVFNKNKISILMRVMTLATLLNYIVNEDDCIGMKDTKLVKELDAFIKAGMHALSFNKLKNEKLN